MPQGSRKETEGNSNSRKDFEGEGSREHDGNLGISSGIQKSNAVSVLLVAPTVQRVRPWVKVRIWFEGIEVLVFFTYNSADIEKDTR